MSMPWPAGKYHDEIIKTDNTRITFGWRPNVVVDQCRNLLAAFIKGETALGIQRIDLGRGDSLWDSSIYTSPPASTSSLVDSGFVSILASTADMSIEFIDPTGAVTATPSNRIEVTVNVNGTSLPLSTGEIFPLREFALMGRHDSTDFMIDYVRHPVINIVSGDVLVRKIRLTF
jgi:hypothetical protein